MKIKQKPEDFQVTEIPNRAWKPQGKYWVYQLTKTNKTTLEAVDAIAKYMKIDANELRFSGLKDKKAITTQFITSPIQLYLEHDAITIEHVGFTEDPLHFGDLKANHFKIRVTGIEHVRDVTIPNYYGDQRFSTHNLEIGMHIIKGEFDEAAQLLAQQFSAVKKQYKKTPKSPVVAIRKAPFHSTLLCVHSVQSFLWNEAIGAWVKEQFKIVEEAPYAHGTLYFPQGIIPEGDVPLVGAAQDLEGWKEYYDPILEKHGITPASFMIRAIPKLTQEGTTRPITPIIQDKEIDFDKKTGYAEFSLSPGSYATICLKGWFA